MTGQGDVAGRLVETAGQALYEYDRESFAHWNTAADTDAMYPPWEQQSEQFRREFRSGERRAVLAAVLPLLADEIAERAETILYDGDADQPLPGCYETLDVADLLRDLAVRVAR